MEIPLLVFLVLFIYIASLRVVASSGASGHLMGSLLLRLRGMDDLHVVVGDASVSHSLDSFRVSPSLIGMIFNYVQERSPPHLSYIIYDDTYKDMVDVLPKQAGHMEAIMIIEFSSQLNRIQDILSVHMDSVTTKSKVIYVFCSVGNTARIFNMITSQNLESRSLLWIAVAPSQEAAENLQILLREGSQVIILQMESQESFLLLRSEVNRTGEVRFEQIGTWKKILTGYQTHLDKDLFTDLEKAYSNMNGRLLTLTANDDYPFIRLVENEYGDVFAVEGFEYVIITALSEALNFTFQMTSPADGKWGGPLPNGTVVGIIGDVSNRRAHFALCEISITRIRETVIDFTYPYYIDTATLISRSPRERNRAFAAFSPFSPESWLCIAIATIIIGCSMVVESQLIDVYTQGRHDVCTFNDAMFNAFRSLLKQESLIPAYFWPLRFTLVFWYLVCLIISVLYSGMLIATLIKPSFEKPINGLVDLPAATNDGFTLVVTGDTIFEYMFKEAKDGIYAETWKLFNHRDRSKSFLPRSRKALDTLVEKKQVVVSGELNFKYHATRRGISKYHFARDTFAPQLYGAPCSSGSPLIPIFNKLFLHMMEGGLISKWINDEFQKAASKSVDFSTKGPKAFTILHLQAAFYILIIGFFAASTGFLAEKLLQVFMDHK